MFKNNISYKWQIPSETLLETTTSGNPLTPSSLIACLRLNRAAWDSPNIWEKAPSKTVTPMVKPVMKNNQINVCVCILRIIMFPKILHFENV